MQSLNFFKRTLGSLQRISVPCRFQSAQNQPPLVVERALRSIKLEAFETSVVRNFCIIAHVDHGRILFKSFIYIKQFIFKENQL